MLAAKAFPGQSAIGKRLLIRLITPEPEWVEVIGVVAHQRDTSLAVAGREQIYFTDGYLGHGAAGYWAIHTAGDPARYTSAVRAAIGKLDPQLLLTDIQPMDALVAHAQDSTRFSLLLIGVFASVAALLAGVGLYGVLSTVVRQRTPEIGVRMALGAAPATIFGLVVGQGLRLSVTGIGLGLVAAFALTRAMTSMLVGVKPADPATFASMAVLFLLIAAVASWLPARRAAGLDPTSALREE
jgi:putative ABC transport system permease protein